MKQWLASSLPILCVGELIGARPFGKHREDQLQKQQTRRTTALAPRDHSMNREPTMKTLIFFIAAALASPVFGHTGNSSTTSTDTTSTSSEYSDSGSMSESGSSPADSDAAFYEEETIETEDPSLSGSSTSDSPQSTDSVGATDSIESSRSQESDASLSGASTGTSATTPETTTDTMGSSNTNSSLSGASSAPAATTPAPAASSPVVIVPPAAPATQTSAAPQPEAEEGVQPGGYYIEPAILGSRQENRITGVGNGTTDSTSFGADLKLGGHINESFFLAVDGRYERATLEDVAFQDTNADVYNWGPSLGFQAPKYGLRAWGTYVVDGVYNPEAGANGVNLEFKNPYGWRGGLGVRFAAVSVNVEYQDLTYRNTDIESLGTATAPGAIDFDERGYSLSLSFPMDL